MRNRTRLNLVLLGVALLLGGLLASQQLNKPTADSPPATLTGLTREEVRHIRIQQADAPEIELRRINGQWQLLQPVKALAEASEVAPLLRLASASSHRQIDARAVETQRTGVESPEWTVFLNEEKLELGDNGALGNQRYVRNGDVIHLIDEPNTHALDPDYAHFIARRLLPEKAEIDVLELPDWRISRNADGTLSVTPVEDSIRGDDLTNTVAAWERARGLWISNAEDPAPESAGRIRIELDNGDAHEFAVLAREPQLLLYSPSLNVIYHLAAHQWPALLDLIHPDSGADARPVLKPRPDVGLPMTDAH